MSKQSKKTALYELLDKYSKIIEKVEEEYNKNFNIFKVLKVSHFEVKHSNFMAWLFKFNEWNIWGIEKSFLQRFFDLCSFDDIKVDVYYDVKTEYCISEEENINEVESDQGRIDIAIIGNKKSDDMKSFTCTIENKYGSGIHDYQLPRYKGFIGRTYNEDSYINKFVFLDISKPPRFDEENSEYDGYTFVSYSQILTILKGIKSEIKDNINDIRWDFIEQYIDLLEENEKNLDVEICDICKKIEIDDVLAILKEKKKISSFNYRKLRDCEQVFLDVIEKFYNQNKYRMDCLIKENLLEILVDKKQDLGKYGYAYSVKVPSKKINMLSTVDYDAVSGINIGIYAGLDKRMSSNLLGIISSDACFFYKLKKLCENGWIIKMKYKVKMGDMHTLVDVEYDIDKIIEEIEKNKDNNICEKMKTWFPSSLMGRHNLDIEKAKEYAKNMAEEKMRNGKKTRYSESKKYVSLCDENGENKIIKYIKNCEMFDKASANNSVIKISEYCKDNENTEKYLTPLYCIDMQCPYHGDENNQEKVQAFFYNATQDGLSVFGEEKKDEFMKLFSRKK